MCILLLECLYKSVRSAWCIVLFKSATSLWILCMLFIAKSQVLKSPAFTVLLFFLIAPFIFALYKYRYSNAGWIYIYNCFILLLDCPLCHYMFILSVFIFNFSLKPILSDMYLELPLIFLVAVCWKYFFCPFT